MEDDNEPPLDPNVASARPKISQYDLEDHRACTVYIGYYVPICRRKGHHRHHRHHHKSTYSCGGRESGHDNQPGTPPSERVQFLLGEEEDGSHEPHPLFSEMEELVYHGDEVEWRETARWIKFEEDVEEGGNRWSKPHIATISLHSLFELRSLLLNGSIILDLESQDLGKTVDLILDDMEMNNLIPSEHHEIIKQVLLRPHRHQHELHREWAEKGSRLPIIRSFTEVGRNSSKITSHRNSASTGAISDNIGSNLSSHSFRGALSCKNGSSDDDSASDSNFLHRNQSFMRKIPPKSEASNILVGELDCLDKIVSCFVRLNVGCDLGDLTEVPLPTRFIFILLGPPGNALKFHEIGRAIATLLSDEVFHGVAYKAKDRSDLLAGVDEFLDATTVLPPGVWDPATRIEPPSQIISQVSRKKPDPKKTEITEISSEIDYNENLDLDGNKKFFGGLVDDVKRKASYYLSDFKDVLALQCISSIVFLYIACIAQIVTFGGLLAHVTENKITGSGCLISALICGLTYSLFSGQPLTLLGSTVPLLVLESIFFDITSKMSIDYLPIRVWIGVWTSIYLLILVACNVTILLRYITRFTEEIFAFLVSVYFIYKAFKSVMQIARDFPIKTRFHTPQLPLCFCYIPNVLNITVSNENQCQTLNGISIPVGCSYTPPFYVPDIFFMSVILFIGTFVAIMLLREMKNTPFFPLKIRIGIADFSVLLAVVGMTLLDYFAQLQTPKLEVPRSFKPSLSERDWFIPFFGTNSWWTAVAAMIPALLLSITIYMDHQITTVIVNRKENKLRKRYGYHLDMFVLACLIFVCSLMGLPWFVAATVLSITHVNSLKYTSHCSAPGDKPHFIGVREQRVTHFVVYLLVGLSFFFTDVLQFIPMPVLYGVFLFMGFTSLKGLQFFERILLLFMPLKYQPDYSYLRHVPIFQVRIYTLIQLGLFGLLFICKFFKFTSALFPFVLLGVFFIRKCLGCFFKKSHLKMLDDDMPEAGQIKKQDDQNSSSLSDVAIDVDNSKSTMNTRNSHANINISEVLTQSSIWKSINQQSEKATKKFLVAKHKKKKRCKKDCAKSEEHRRLSVMEEEEEDNVNTSLNLSPSQSPTVPSDSVTPEKNETKF